MAQEIVTKFVGDTSELDKALERSSKAIDDLDDSAKRAGKAMGDLSGAMGQVAGRVTTAAEAGKAMGKAMQQAGDAGASGAAKAQGMWASVFGKVKGGATDAAGKVKSAWSGGLQGMKDALKDAAETAASTFGTVGTKVVGALGPIGVAIAVIVGLFAKLFASTDAGATKLDGLRRSFGMVFDKIVGAFKSVTDAITSGDTAVGKFFGAISDGVAFVTAPLTGLVSLIGRITGLSDAFADANAAGQKLAQMYDDIDDAQIGNIQKNAELERQINRLNIQLRDRTKTDAERLAIADDLFRLEKQRSEEELAILKQTTAAKQFQADQELKNKGEVNDALRRELAEAKAAETRALTDSETLQENAKRRVNQIKEQAANEAKAIAEKAAQQEQQRREKAKAAAEKAAQEEKARLEKLAQARANATELAAQAELELRKAEAAPHEARRLDLAEKYRQEVERVKDAFAELRQVVGDNAEDIEAIKQQEADAVTAIERRRIIEEEALEQQRVDEINRINQGVADRALESAKKRFDGLAQIHEAEIAAARANGESLTALAKKQAEERAALQQSIRDEEIRRIEDRHRIELDAAEKAGADTIALEEQQLTEINELRERYRQEDLANEEAANAVRKAEQEAMMALAQGTVDFLRALGSENREAQAVALAIEKAAAIANIIIKTQEAIAFATAQAVSNPILAGTLPFRLALLKATSAMSIATIMAQTIGQMQGAYEGEAYIDGRPDLPGASRDAYIRRVHKGERIVTAEDNRRHWDMLEAMRNNRIGDWLAKQMPNYGEALALNFAPRVNAYIDSPEGQRTMVAVTMPGGFDKRIVRAQRESNALQRENNRLLRAALTGRAPNISKRYR